MFMHVSGCSEPQKMCDNAAEKNSKMLKFFPDCFEIQEM